MKTLQKTPEEILKDIYLYHKEHILPDNNWADWEDCKTDGTCAMVIDAMELYAKTVSEQRDKEIAELKGEIEKLKASDPLEEQPICPCTILDEPCTPHCTCKEPFSSRGCYLCAQHGSEEQRKAKAKWIKERVMSAVLEEQPNKGYTEEDIRKAITLARREDTSTKPHGFIFSKEEIIASLASPNPPQPPIK